MILITGGVRSGKSSLGEDLLKGCEKVLYIATSIPFDEEMKERVKKHKENRNKKWDTLEAYKDLEKNIKGEYGGIIVECITVMVTNLLLEKLNEDNENYEEAEKYIMQEIKKMVGKLKALESKVVIITNEVGAGIVPENRLSREYRDILGRVNQYLARECEDVYLSVCGIPLKVK